MNKRQQLKIDIAAQIFANNINGTDAASFAIESAEKLIHCFEKMEGIKVTDEKEVPNGKT